MQKLGQHSFPNWIPLQCDSPLPVMHAKKLLREGKVTTDSASCSLLTVTLSPALKPFYVKPKHFGSTQSAFHFPGPFNWLNVLAKTWIHLCLLVVARQARSVWAESQLILLARCFWRPSENTVNRPHLMSSLLSVPAPYMYPKKPSRERLPATTG